MATTDATAFPVRGQAYRLYGVGKDPSTGALYNGTLTVTASRVKDWTTEQSTDNPAVSYTGIGYWYVDLTADEMTASCIIVRIQYGELTNEDVIVINPLDLREIHTEGDDHWHQQATVKFEQAIVQAAAYLLNRNALSATGTQTIMLSSAADTGTASPFLTAADWTTASGSERGRFK